jgi:hypothetical protein
MEQAAVQQHQQQHEKGKAEHETHVPPVALLGHEKGHLGKDEFHDASVSRQQKVHAGGKPFQNQNGIDSIEKAVLGFGKGFVKDAHPRFGQSRQQVFQFSRRRRPSLAGFDAGNQGAAADATQGMDQTRVHRPFLASALEEVPPVAQKDAQVGHQRR